MVVFFNNGSRICCFYRVSNPWYVSLFIIHLTNHLREICECVRRTELCQGGEIKQFTRFARSKLTHFVQTSNRLKSESTTSAATPSSRSTSSVLFRGVLEDLGEDVLLVGDDDGSRAVVQGGGGALESRWRHGAGEGELSGELATLRGGGDAAQDAGADAGHQFRGVCRDHWPGVVCNKQTTEPSSVLELQAFKKLFGC